MMIFINSERVSVLAGVETDWDSLTEVTVLHEAAGSQTAAHETSATPARSNSTLSIWERLGCTTHPTASTPRPLKYQKLVLDCMSEQLIAHEIIKHRTCAHAHAGDTV